ncbi:2-oxo acid dehydrogenase subunit E2 [Croceicoccus hydrothermalis]|uniref:2-oxo acid dehydrogenase subunit E2 n=1 Tax=Croceicoccus hydrothermalis TaxID=2867964 RepID=UPI001EFAC411|nr:2-oxo acid dehydrogenase subunit E2 [Croceicoccus hydrothermalis]
MAAPDQPPASPSARKLADEHGLDLATVTATGPNGRITRGDVENAIAAGPPPTSVAPKPAAAEPAPAASEAQDNVSASPIARRMAAERNIDLATVKGSGPNGKIVKADIENYEPGSAPAPAPAKAEAQAPVAASSTDAREAPYEQMPLNNVRKTIARRLTEAKQTIPHIYLTVDIRLDALLALRGQINASLAANGGKVSVNDMLIKALAVALERVPQCNVSYRENVLYKYLRSDISVAVAAPSGLITPIVRDAASRGVASISSEMKELAGKAQDGKLQPHEFQGGTASLSNLGMFGIKQFDAVINPPQAVILAVGAGELRPVSTENGVESATVMTATGSFDHRAIDGADGAQLMQAFREICENPMSLVV